MKHRVLGVRFAALLLLAGAGWAQLTTGSLTGMVQDPSGGVIPGASVTLTDVAKNFNYRGTTDETGHYTFRALPPGTYSLTVEAGGFARFTRTNIALDVSTNATVNIEMVLATTGQAVEVSDSGAPLLQTQDASTGQTLTRTFINDLPLIGRAVYDLAYLAPGVSQPTGNAYANANGIGNNFVSQGNRNAQADVLLDGASTTNYEQNTGFVTPLYTPSVDAVEEFKIQQTNFSAEFGFSGGTLVNVITRSGTNQFHGSVYEFFRNTHLNANSYFFNALPSNAGQRPAYHWNNFGGTVGGPIRKDRLFFFFDYDGSRQVTPTSKTLGFPSAAERAGDFGELCGRYGGTFLASGQCSAAAGQIWDPYVLDTTKSNPTRTQFIPFNQIAKYASPGNAKAPWITPNVAGNLMNPVAQKILPYVPLPNLGTPGAAGYNPYYNWFGTGSNVDRPNQFDAKTDARITERDLLSVRISHSWGYHEDANLLGNVFDANTQGPNNHTVYSASANYTHTFGPNTILTATGGYTHSWSHTQGNTVKYSDFNITDLGLPASLLSSGFPAAPAIQFDGYGAENGNANFGGQPWSGMLYGQSVAQIIGSVSHTRGGHEFKAGAEVRQHRINFTQYGLPAGKFQFGQTGTSQQYADGGDSIASFMMGFPGGGWNAYEIPASPATQNYQYAFFAQDNWRVSSRLTLNLGIRFDVDLPRTERYDRMSYFDPSAPGPVPGTTGSLMYVGNGNPRSPFDTYYGAIGPRVGFAYQVANNTTVRGGYGLYYSPSKGGAAGNGSGGAGFLGYDTYTTFSVYNSSDNITPSLVMGQPMNISRPPGKSQGVYTNLGGELNGVPIRSYNMLPRIQSWSLSIQHELPSNILVEGQYVGTKGNHLYLGGNTYALDHLPPSVADQFRANPQAFNATVPIPASLAQGIQNVTPAWSNGVWGNVWQAYNAYVPYPQYTWLWGGAGLQNVDPPIGNSIYHAFHLRVEKRFSQGLQFLTTWSIQKSIDDSSIAGSNVWVNGSAGSSLARVQDPNNLRLERSISQFDISQILQFSAVYQIPYGPGMRWGRNATGVAKAVLGNWQTNGIYRWDTGLPIILFLNGGTSLPTYGNQRPNLTSALHKADGTNITQYFANPQAAVSPQPYYDGNAPRVMPNVRAPGTNNLSMSIFKDFPLPWREASRLQFRAEAFNAFNRVQFGAPNTSVGLTSLGAITSQANSPRAIQLALKLYW